MLPRALSQLGACSRGTEIHPGTQIGRCFFIDDVWGLLSTNGDRRRRPHALSRHDAGRHNPGACRASSTLGTNVVVGVGGDFGHYCGRRQLPQRCATRRTIVQSSPCLVPLASARAGVRRLPLADQQPVSEALARWRRRSKHFKTSCGKLQKRDHGWQADPVTRFIESSRSGTRLERAPVAISHLGGTAIHYAGE